MKESTPALLKTTWEKQTAQDTCLSEVLPDQPQQQRVPELTRRGLWGCVISLIFVSDATKITLAPSNADINQGENVSLQCHASHDPTMDLSFTWTLNGVVLDLEDSAGPYRRMEGVSTCVFMCVFVCMAICVSFCSMC